MQHNFIFVQRLYFYKNIYNITCSLETTRLLLETFFNRGARNSNVNQNSIIYDILIFYFKSAKYSNILSINTHRRFDIISSPVHVSRFIYSTYRHRRKTN